MSEFLNLAFEEAGICRTPLPSLDYNLETLSRENHYMRAKHNHDNQLLCPLERTGNLLGLSLLGEMRARKASH